MNTSMRIALAVVCIAALLLATSCGKTAPADTNTNDQVAAVESSKQAGAIYDPPIWCGVLWHPYAVAEIRQVTDTTANICDENAETSVKLECVIRFAYNTKQLQEADRYSAGVSADSISSDSTAEIYVSEKSAQQLKAGDIIFFKVRDQEVQSEEYPSGHVFFSPFTDKDGYSQYVLMPDGKVDLQGKGLSSFCLDEIQILNDNLSSMASLIREVGDDSVSTPDRFGNGTTIEGIREYFRFCERADEASREWRASQK